MSEWQNVKLKDIGVSFLSGYGFKSANYVDSGVPLIKIGNIQNNVVLINLNGDFISKQSLSEKEECYLLKNNDVLIAMTGQGSVGRVGKLKLLDKDIAILNQRVGKFISDEINSHLNFIYYVLISSQYQELLFNIAIGSGQPNLSPNLILDVEIPLYSYQEQKAIADVLSALDDKIDLLQRQNETLEKMAETLFRQWFIESETINSLPLYELIEFNPKYSLSKGSKSTYLEMAGLSNTSFNAEGFYPREFTSGMKFKNQDTLLARITPCLENGKAAYIHFLNQDEIGWGSTEYIVMHPKKDLHPLFAYILARNSDFKEYAENCMEGSSGRQRVNLDHLKEFTVNYPDNGIIVQFNDFLNSIEPKLVYNSKQIQTLKNMRDTLLPKLMSGEVRVKLD